MEVTRLFGAAKLALAASVCVGVLAATASAQPRLPAGDQQSYTDSERGSIAEYAQWLTETIGEGEGGDTEAARRHIERALRDTSVRFRQELAQVLLPTDAPFRALTASEDIQRASSALTIVGLVADRRSVPVLAAAMRDEREPVRIAAASAAGAMLVRSTGGDATSTQNASSLIRALSDALRVETSAKAARSQMGAMLATPNEPRVLDDGLRSAAAALAERVVSLRENHAGTLVEDGVVEAESHGDWAATQARLVQTAVRRMLAAGAGAELDREMLVSVANVAALAIANVRDAAAELEEADRLARIEGDEDTQRAQRFAGRALPLVGVTEQFLMEVQPRILGAAVQRSRTVFPAWQAYARGSGSLDDVRSAVGEWVGPGRVLTDPPFNFDGRDFEEPEL